MNCPFCNAVMQYMQGYHLCHQHPCLIMIYEPTNSILFCHNGYEIAINKEKNVSALRKQPDFAYKRDKNFMQFNEQIMTKDDWTYNHNTEQILTLNRAINVDPNNFNEALNIFKKLLIFS